MSPHKIKVNGTISITLDIWFHEYVWLIGILKFIFQGIIGTPIGTDNTRIYNSTDFFMWTFEIIITW